VLPTLGASVAGDAVSAVYKRKKNVRGAGPWGYKACVVAPDDVTLYTLETSQRVRSRR
jgi:ribosomal protein L32E